MKKIITLGDGYAYGHLWPSWPQLLQILFPNYDVINLSANGAGQEFLVSQLISNIDEARNNYVIFQWPVSNRFDKLLDNDEHWKEITNKDIKYHKNFYKNKFGLWWLSSASQLDEISTYHNMYIEQSQHSLRQDLFQQLVENTLENIGATYIKTSSKELENFSRETRFLQVRQEYVQPSPLVQLYFLTENILPKLKLTFDEKRLKNLEEKVSKINWVAFDPKNAFLLQDI